MLVVCLNLLSWLLFYKLFQQIDDSLNRGQVANPYLQFNKYPLFYKHSEQQLTTSVNEDQIKIELVETGYSITACTKSWVRV